jgi:hypothetical protein
MLTKEGEERMRLLRKTVRKHTRIDKDAILVKIKAMDDNHLLKAYMLSLRWYEQVQKEGEKALNTIFNIWDMAPVHPHDFMSDKMDIPGCCFEQEADYVLSAMELVRFYVLALQKEVKRRNLSVVMKRMLKPFANGRRGWDAKHKTAAV